MFFALYLHEFVKFCIHERATYTRAVWVKRVSGAWLINFPRTWGKEKNTQCMERTPGASSSLRILAKNRQISIYSEWYGNRLWTKHHRFADPSTHTCIWLRNCLRFGLIRKGISCSTTCGVHYSISTTWDLLPRIDANIEGTLEELCQNLSSSHYIFRVCKKLCSVWSRLKRNLLLYNIWGAQLHFNHLGPFT